MPLNRPLVFLRQNPAGLPVGLPATRRVERVAHAQGARAARRRTRRRVVEVRRVYTEFFAL